MASQADHPSPPSSPISPISPVLLPQGLDRIDIPYDLDALAQTETNNQHSHSLPAGTIPDDPHPFGILNSIHLRLLVGRDAHPTLTMEPAMPARVVRRNDFPTLKKAKATNTDTTTTTPPTTWGKSELDDLAHRVLKPTFPPHLEGVVETRHRSEAKKTENLKGFEDELEAVIRAKCENGERYRAFRTRFYASQDALALRAGEARAAREVHAGVIRETYRRGAVYPEESERALADDVAVVVGCLVARLAEMDRGIRVLTVHMGLMFALGRAVDQAVFPGNFDDFDEMACSPKYYLSSHFPEFARRPADPIDPTTLELELLPSHMQPLLSPVWDFALTELLNGSKRARLRDLWEAACAGDWEAVEEKTRGDLAKADELLAVIVERAGV